MASIGTLASAQPAGVLGARRLDFSEIPLIDIGGLLAGSDAGKRAVAERIGWACRNIGFFYVVNHRIPQATIDRVAAETAAFFDLPLKAKMQYDINRLQRHRGYCPYGEVVADVTAEPDHQEGYEVGLELPADDPDLLAGNIMYGPNVWPAEVPGLRAAVYPYFESVVALGRALFHAFALTLGVREDFFDDKIDKPMAQLRLLYYPPHDETTVRKERLGVGMHTDYECFTILAQTAPGLQVMNPRGEWVEVPPVPGSFVINIGDMLMRWTNGAFASTPHRVVNLTGKARYSFPLFFGANFDAVVRCLPNFCSPANPPKYPPTVCGHWTVRNITDVYNYRRAFRGKVPNPELT